MTPGWSNLTAVLSRGPATGREQDVELGELAGKTVALRLTFVRAEQDLDGSTRHLYRWEEGGRVVECFVKGRAAGKPSGLFTGKITRIRYVRTDLRGVRHYMVWLQADEQSPLDQTNAPPAK